MWNLFVDNVELISRYPATSLSAQLKAQTFQNQEIRKDRAPPSPSPNPLNRSIIGITNNLIY